MGGEAEKPCLPGTEPKLTASAKPQVQNTSNYPCFSSVRAPPSLCLGNRDLTASFHPAFVCLIPFFGAGVAFWPVLVGCLAEQSSPPCSLPITAIVLQIIGNCNAVVELHTGTSVLELDIASPCSDIRVSLIV